MGRKVCTSATRKEVRKEQKDVQVGRNKRKSNPSTSVEPKPKLTSPEFGFHCPL